MRIHSDFFLKACESKFLTCVDDQNASTALEKTEAFATCMDTGMFESLGCDAECAPTYNMLISSEVPSTAEFNNFGAGAEKPGERPDDSLCIAEE